MVKFNQLKVAFEKSGKHENFPKIHESDALQEDQFVENHEPNELSYDELEPSLPLAPDILNPHLVQWRLGAQMFDYDVTDIPKPRGLIIGECSGRSNPRIPLFPSPPTSVGAYLLGYTPISERNFMGLLMRTNLCPTIWDDDIASMRVETLKHALLRQKTPPRILLLGKKVATAWRVSHKHDFDWCTLIFDDKKLEIAWIPYPSAMNKIYNEKKNQDLAGYFVRWAAGLEKELRR